MNQLLCSQEALGCILHITPVSHSMMMPQFLGV